jgi:predicted RNA-binding protein with PIN domain
MFASLFPGITGLTPEIDQRWDFCMRKWLVDGMNVVGSRPDGWWRDRPGAMKALAQKLATFAEAEDEPVAVVFDGRPFDVDAGRVEVSFAPTRGPNAADDEIARMVAADAEPAGIVVVTSDRNLADRVRVHGAEVMSAGAFRRRLDAI